MSGTWSFKPTTKLLKYSLKIFATSLPSEIILSFSTKVMLSKLFDLSEKHHWTLCYLQRVWYSSLKSNFFLLFLSSLTHIFLCLLYAFQSSSDLLFRNLFLKFDLTMTAFLSSLIINDAWLALTYFFLRDAKLFKDVKQTFWKFFNANSKDHTLLNLIRDIL